MTPNGTNQSEFDYFDIPTDYDESCYLEFVWNAKNDIPEYLKKTFGIAELVFVVCGFLGNVLTMFIIGMKRKLRSPTYYAIASLAFADVLVITLTFIFENTNIHMCLFQNTKFENPESFTAWDFVNVLDGTIMTDSALNIMFIAFIRYALIVHPFKCRIHLTSKLVVCCAICFWVVSFLLGLIFALPSYLYLKHEGLSAETVFKTVRISIGMTIIQIAIPMIWIFVLHCLKIKALKSTTVSPAIPQRMSRMLAVILILRTFFAIAEVLFMSIILTDNTIVRAKYVWIVSNLLFVISYAVNPFIYFLFSLRCRRQQLTLTSCSRPGLHISRGNTTHTNKL